MSRKKMTHEEHQAAAREAIRLLEQAAQLIGWQDPGGRPNERTTAGKWDRLAKAARSNRQANALVNQAQALWWRLVQDLHRIAYWEARRSLPRCRGTGLTAEDLQSEAQLGLYRGVMRWDPERGIRLGHYAGQWCRSQIWRQIDTTGRYMRSPSWFNEVRMSVYKWHYAGVTDHEELAELANTTVEEVQRVLFAQEPVSMDTQLSDTDLRLGDTLTDGFDLEEDVVRTSMINEVRLAIQALEEVDPRCAEVLRSRMAGEYLEQIGDRIGMSRERVRQVEGNALDFLRQRLSRRLGMKPSEWSGTREFTWDQLRKVLAAGPVTAPQLADREGCSLRQAREALHGAYNYGLLANVSRGTYALPGAQRHRQVARA